MIDIPGFILAIREGNMEQAANILSKYTNLPRYLWTRLSARETM